MCRGQVPRARARALGFPHIAVSGQKGYHGVAILSRLPFTLHERRDICGRGHARHLSVKLGEANGQGSPLVLHNIYVPAGGDIPDPVAQRRSSATSSISSRRWAPGSAAMRGKRKNRMIVVGDLNVAPLPTDVWSHKQLLKVVSHTPDEVERFERVHASHDFVDVMRRHVPADEKLFTWWSYRNRDWRASNRGTAPRSYLDDAGRSTVRRSR